MTNISNNLWYRSKIWCTIQIWISIR